MEQKVLVISPGYPSEKNPYICAFVHTRVKEYRRQGLDVSICLWNVERETPLRRTYEGVEVCECNMHGLRAFIDENGPYGVIVAHFADVPVLNILERESHRSRIVVIMHGGDVLGEHYSCHMGRPYFEAEEDERLHYGEWLPRKLMYRRMKDNDAIHWVFVSDSLRQDAEAHLGFSFGRNAHVIGNWIRDDLFVYRRKKAEQRRKIYFCRRFDNEKVYCVDTVMIAIRRLSTRDFFKDLEFHVYGDGKDYDRLVAPVLGFENVKLHRHFMDNSRLPEVLSDFGIGLFPSRYDAQPVAIQEAARSGLVCIGGGTVRSVCGIFPPESFGPALVNPDSPDELAAAIERLYKEPELFLDLSARMSRRVAEASGKEKTIDVECRLIGRLCDEPQTPSVDALAEKQLSIIVPAYNMQKYLDVCIDSLVRHDRVGELEVLVVNDGSTDSTLAIADKWRQRYPNTVRVIDKKNGGHGSCINAALPVAAGRYVRIIDADDWVVSSNLAHQVERLRMETADCVLTYGNYDYVEDGTTAPIFRYPNLVDGMQRSFDDLQFEGYGFKGYGPLLSTASWKRTVLIASKTHIPEGISYADMLWNVMPIWQADTVVLYDLDIYRYTMGRAGQSISREALLNRWEHHDQVFFAVAKFALGNPNLTSAKRKYVLHNILGELGCNNIWVLDLARGHDEVKRFLKRLRQPGNEDLAREVVRFTCRHNVNSRSILCSMALGRALVRLYASDIMPADSMSLNGPGDAGCMKSIFAFARRMLGVVGVKKIVKGALPYGVVRIFQKRIYGK